MNPEAACQDNLRQIDVAKQQWALSEMKQDTDVPEDKDLGDYLREGEIQSGDMLRNIGAGGKVKDIKRCPCHLRCPTFREQAGCYSVTTTR